jgi:hypothetical protein
MPATRGAFHNPTRHRGRLFALATATTDVRPLPEAVELAGRDYVQSVSFRLELLTPLHQGVELSPLIPRLASFPNKRGWSMALRRPLVGLTDPDATLLRHELEQVAAPETREAIGAYLAAARPVVRK